MFKKITYQIRMDLQMLLKKAKTKNNYTSSCYILSKCLILTVQNTDSRWEIDCNDTGIKILTKIL